MPSSHRPATPRVGDSRSEVDDVVLLQTLPGLVDTLADELRQLAPARAHVVRRWRSAVLVEYAGPVAALASVPLYSTCSVWTGVDADGPAAAERVVEVMRRVATVDSWRPGLGVPEAPARFRVDDIGGSRWVIRDALVAEGFENSPGDWEFNVDTFDGVVVITVGSLHTTRRFGALERIPASTNPVLAAALARMVKAKPGAVVVDPFCGAGTNLVSVSDRYDDVTLFGFDVKQRALRACRENLEARAVDATIAQATATQLPMPDHSVDRVVANLPFGKRVGSHDINARLYPAFTRELGRVLNSSGRAVLLTEDKRLLVDSVQRTHGLKVVRVAVLETGGLHPSAFVVERSRKVRPRATRAPG